MHEAARSFSSDLRSVSGARRFLMETMEDWGQTDYAFGAPLVLTELATNAVLHARTPYRVRLTLEGQLVVQVQDASARLPRRRESEIDAVTGRGLGLVAALCDDWGANATGAGKVVWAAVRTDDENTQARNRRWTA